jgi:hypothetical protein
MIIKVSNQINDVVQSLLKYTCMNLQGNIFCFMRIKNFNKFLAFSIIFNGKIICTHKILVKIRVNITF